jgi:DNA-directed RNA polymerase specialized sigma24 family protein
MDPTPLPPSPPDISDEAWLHVFSALVRYFTGKLPNPEDLAQMTLMRVAACLRKGKIIEGDHGFEKFCFGFGRNVLQEERRRKIPEQLPEDRNQASPVNKTRGLNSVEARIFLLQALSQLSPEDQELIEDAENMSSEQLEKKYGKSKSVKLFRARKRLQERLREMLDPPRDPPEKP